jgi:hypothetical protein
MPVKERQEVVGERKRPGREKKTEREKEREVEITGKRVSKEEG